MAESAQPTEFEEWLKSQNAKQGLINKLIEAGIDSIDVLGEFQLDDMDTLSKEIGLSIAEKMKFKSIGKSIAKRREQSSSDRSPSFTTIVISEKEQSVIDSIHANMKILDKIESELSWLNNGYPQSVNKIKTTKLNLINNTKTKMKNVFDDIRKTLTLKEKELFHELEQIENNINNKNENKEMEILSNSGIALKKARQYLKEQKEICYDLMTNHKNRNERKEKILHIGTEIKKTFDEANKTLTQNMNNINKCTQRNAKMHPNIDFVINNKKYKKITNNMNNFGVIINDENQKSNLNLDINDDEDDVIIKELTKNVNSLNEELKISKLKCVDLQNEMQEIKNKSMNKLNNNNEIMSLLKEENEKMQQQKLRHLSAISTSLTFPNDSKYRWFKEEKEENTPVRILTENPLYIGCIDGSTKENIKPSSLLFVSSIKMDQDITKMTANLRVYIEQKLSTLKFPPRVKTPVKRRCPTCNGTGIIGSSWPCDKCGHSGLRGSGYIYT
eukprot:307451_1